MRRFHFTDEQVAQAASALGNMDPIWLAAALALAARKQKEPRDAAAALRNAIANGSYHWDSLQREFGVMTTSLRDVHRDANGNIIQSTNRQREEAQVALLAHLRETLGLDDVSLESRVEALEKTVATLTRQLAALQAVAVTPA